MGMNLTDGDLFPGEEVLVTKMANLWVKPSRHGLSKFAFNKYLGDNESIGGKAYLTTYRIVFKSHGFNRLVGKHSLFLPNVVEIRKKFLGIVVESRAQAFHFVMWFSGKFVRTALERRDALGEEEFADLKKLITEHPDRLGEGLRKHATFEAINKVLRGVTQVGDVMGKLTGADQNTFAELVALFAGEE